jgi:hypothetical protein
MASFEPEGAPPGEARTTEGPAPPAPRRRFRPRPFELVSLAGALATLAFLRWGGYLHLGPSSVWFTAAGVFTALPAYFAVGVALQCAARAAAGGSVRDYLRAVATRRWLAGWLRLWLAVTATIYAYLWLKTSVPLVRHELFDLELFRLDRWLHFGVSPTILAVEAANGTLLPELLDRWYALFLVTVQLGFAYVTAGTDEASRRSFVGASALLWIAGAWLYVAVPALGPCYALPELREPIRDEMPRAVGAQDYLFRHYGRMVQSPGRFLASFNPSLGVAALPSLHVGAHWLLALWARRHARRLFLPLALATGLTFLGSVVSTWHYAVDGYAGALLAWLAWRVAASWETGSVEPARWRGWWRRAGTAPRVPS